jgi:hypothetical protein
VIVPRALVGFGLLLATACFGDDGGPTESPYSFAFTDAAGDTVTTAGPTDPKAVDLVGVSGDVDDEEIHLVLTFAEAVAPWSEQAANSLDGFVYFDLDQASTGLVDVPRGMGIDSYLDLRDDGDGHLALVGVLNEIITLVPVSFDGAALTVTIPRSALRTPADADNRFFLAVEVGVRGRAAATDLGPDTDHYSLPPSAP